MPHSSNPIWKSTSHLNRRHGWQSASAHRTIVHRDRWHHSGGRRKSRALRQMLEGAPNLPTGPRTSYEIQVVDGVTSGSLKGGMEFGIDSSGPDDTNMALSETRAVAAYFRGSRHRLGPPEPGRGGQSLSDDVQRHRRREIPQPESGVPLRSCSPSANSQAVWPDDDVPSRPCRRCRKSKPTPNA